MSDVWYQIRRRAGAAIAKYRMINPGDRIMVCLSGGKDSAVLLRTLCLLQKRSPVKFELGGAVFHPGFERFNIASIKKQAEECGIKLHITGADIPALDVLAGILGMGDGSRLVRILEQEKQLAVTLRSFCYSQPCGGLLGISAAATPGKLRKLESELRRELDRIRKGGLTRAEVSREKTQQLSEHLRELRGIREIAANIGGGVIAADAPDFSDTYLRRLSGLTPDDVTAAAEKYLTPERFSFVIQTPAKSGKRPGAVRFRKRPEPELVESAGLPRLVHLPDPVPCFEM